MDIKDMKLDLLTRYYNNTIDFLAATDPDDLAERQGDPSRSQLRVLCQL